MKTLIVSSALFFAACSHHNNDATTPSAPSVAASDGDSDSDDPSVDPTLPSWAPRSCLRYHTAVVKLIGCETVPQLTRDAAKVRYDADHAKWQAMKDQPQGAIEEVRQSCADDAKLVRGQLTESCR